jgi:hypothetical protein
MIGALSKVIKRMHYSLGVMLLDGEPPAPRRTYLAQVVAPSIQRQAAMGSVLGLLAA